MTVYSVRLLLQMKAEGKRYLLWSVYSKTPENQGLIVIRYYLALRGAENGVTSMVTPFFCVQG